MADTVIEESVISFLEGKNVFIFDTETTGLPDKVPGSQWGSPSEYWDYRMNDKYRNARIVSIAWVYVQSFDKLILEGEIKSIQHYIRYPEGFNEIPTTHIHGISFETAVSSGTPFCDIFENCGLYNKLLNADYIIAHNVMFDIHILLNELSRLGTYKANEVINHIQSLLLFGKCICTGVLGKNICKLEYKSRFGNTNTNTLLTNSKVVGNSNANKKIKQEKKYKMPKLVELYNYFYGCDFDDAHSADGDVKALLKCLMKM
jgi:DNA polymerase III epsilon subunit-like protein